MNKKLANWVIIVISLIAVISVFFIKPIAQDPTYHLFKDERVIWVIQNFWNVVSNLPFLIVGFIGIRQLQAGKLKIIDALKPAYLIFFSGVILVAFGSGYYHLWPDNQTLFWDRLPMTIAFMSLISIIVAEFVCVRVAQIMLWPLVMIGLFSVIYWLYTENAGHGDLRFYGLVQFLPMVIIPIILLSYKAKYTQVSGYWWLLLCYLLAKLSEHFDEAIYTALGFISGHTLKHLFAALGIGILLFTYQSRNESSSGK